MDSKDSAEIARAIVAALRVAVKTLQPPSQSTNTRGRHQWAATSVKGVKDDSKIIMATSASLDKLNGAANNSANALSELTEKTKAANSSLIQMSSFIKDSLIELSQSRKHLETELRKVNFDSLGGSVSKAITDAISSQLPSKKQVGSEKDVKDVKDVLR